MSYYNFNGKLYKDATPVIGPDNRGLRYGDGLFETFKFQGHELVLFDEHLARLWKGLALLQFDIPKLFTPDKLQAETLSLLHKNNHATARIRLAVIRGDGGLYDHNNSLQYIIQSWPLTQRGGKLNENGLQLGIFRDAKKAIDLFSNCKHNNFLPYVMAAMHAKNMKLNDALVLNQHERICDSTIANVFIVKNKQISTPALTEGCIAGIMRKTIIQTLSENNIAVQEKALTTEELLDADEIFLSNSISNMRWVAGVETRSFSGHFCREIFPLLIKTLPGVFC